MSRFCLSSYNVCVVLQRYGYFCCLGTFVLCCKHGVISGVFQHLCCVAGVGLAGLLVGTLDAVFDSKPPPYRILHQAPHSQIYYVVAVGMMLEEVTAHWTWLEQHLLAILCNFDSPHDMHDFVRCKVESLVANERLQERLTTTTLASPDSEAFQSASYKFHKVFGLPDSERLVNYYSCRYAGRVSYSHVSCSP